MPSNPPYNDDWNQPRNTTREEKCQSCEGRGYHNWAGDEMCQQCNGTGKVTVAKETRRG